MLGVSAGRILRASRVSIYVHITCLACRIYLTWSAVTASTWLYQYKHMLDHLYDLIGGFCHFEETKSSQSVAAILLISKR